MSGVHYSHLDGLRGLAALYVMQYHAQAYVQFDDKAEGIGREISFLFSQGHFGVVVFIVLSGYCLMLPCLETGRLRVGMRDFVVRRCRRLLPPYYAALGICGLLLVVAIALGFKSAEEFRPRAWVTHLLLVHHLDPASILEINGPLWSVGSEWHIYFVFALFLLPVWRHWGNLAAIGVGFALGIVVAICLPTTRAACPWFIALFAMGMAAAALGRPLSGAGAGASSSWGKAALVLGVTAYATILWKPGWVLEQDHEVPDLVTMVPDLIAGLSMACFLVSCARSAAGGGTFAMRLLSAKPMVLLGAFSYSLYLIHSPIQSGLATILWKVRPPFLNREWLFFAMLIVASLGAAGLFYLVFERPFTKSRAGGKRELRALLLAINPLRWLKVPARRPIA